MNQFRAVLVVVSSALGYGLYHLLAKSEIYFWDSPIGFYLLVALMSPPFLASFGLFFLSVFAFREEQPGIFIIRSGSWYARLMNRYGGELWKREPRTSCRIFWATVGVAYSSTLAFSVALLIILGVTLIVALAINDPLYTAVGVGIFIAVLGLIVGIITLFAKSAASRAFAAKVVKGACPIVKVE